MELQEQARLLVQPISPRYERYDIHTRRLGSFLFFLRRHRILLSLLAGLLVGFFLVFLFYIGSFFSNAHCQDTVYGEIPDCDAVAFLSGTSFEFAGADGTWQALPPATLGQHKLRAVAKNGFGMPKYSNEMTFTILPRALTLTLSAEGATYGDLDDQYLTHHLQALGLADGDQISTLRWDILLVDGPAALVRLTEIQITDIYGRDVTDCYRFQNIEKRLSIKARPITVATITESFLYNGTDQHPISVQVTSGSLVSGDHLQFQFDPLPVDVGTYELLPQCKFLNSSGEDVSQFYEITAMPGSITITPIELHITTGSATKTYDDTPLICNEWELTSGTVVSSHKLEVLLPNSKTSVGSMNNSPKHSVTDENGKDVTANYKLVATIGYLVVEPRVLKFTTESATKVYNGWPLTASGYTHVEGTILPHHQAFFHTSGTQTFAGSSPNTLSVSIRYGNRPVESNYKIEVESGTLTVIPRDITILSGSAEKLYDGTPLTCENFSIISGMLVNGDAVYMTDFTGSQTEVGTSQNKFRVGISSPNYSGENVTASYRIQYQYGTLTVHPNPNFVPPDNTDPDKPPSTEGTDTPDDIYDPDLGTSIDFPSNHNNDKIFATVYNNIEADLGQVFFRAGSYGDYYSHGWLAPTLYETLDVSPLEFAGRTVMKSTKAFQLEIALAKNCSVLFPYYSRTYANLDRSDVKNDCYFTAQTNKPFYYSVYRMADSGYYNTIQHKLPTELTEEESNYRDHVYANYLDVPDSTRQALLAWAEEKGIQQDSTTLITDIQQAVRNGAVYDPNAESAYIGHVDVAVHFLTVAKAGICQHFATAATLLYRCYGIPARYTVGFAVNINESVTQITGKYAHAWVEIYQPAIGWIPVDVTGSAEGSEGESGDEFYECYIQAADAFKFYDGKPFEAKALQEYTLISGSLMPGHHLEASYAPVDTYVLPGYYSNSITYYRILDENGTDVTHLYDSLVVTPGMLSILPRMITVASGTATKTYDGNALYCEDYWLTQGSLAPGDTLRVTMKNTIVSPGSVANDFEVTVIHIDSWGWETDVTGYYSIELHPGTLTILKDTP